MKKSNRGEKFTYFTTHFFIDLKSSSLFSHDSFNLQYIILGFKEGIFMVFNASVCKNDSYS